MNHLDFDKLNDLIDGRVSAADRAAMETHVAICSECAEQHRRLTRLVHRAATLAPELDPPRAIWPIVHDRITARPTRAFSRPWQLAVAAVLLIALSSAITARVVRRPVIVVRPEAPIVTPITTSLPAPARSLDADYSAIVRELSETLAQRRSQLNPATVAKVEASLRVIDTAINEARAALAADPSNRDLLDLLATSYQQKVELLRRANELPSTT